MDGTRRKIVLQQSQMKIRHQIIPASKYKAFNNGSTVLQVTWDLRMKLTIIGPEILKGARSLKTENVCVPLRIPSLGMSLPK